MRCQFEPHLVNDAFGDPALHVDFLDERRALLFDLGDIAALPPRKLMRLTHVFVTHTHMDHFAGFDPLLRVILGRKERLSLVGGPDFITRVDHKLQAYTWNVVHRYEMPLELDVLEVGADGFARRARFSSRERFACDPGEGFVLDGDTLLEEETFRVRGRFVDHELPCLAFGLEEKAHAKVAKDRLAALGLTTGPWLRDLKRALLEGAPPDRQIAVRWRDRRGEHEEFRSLDELRQVILDMGPGQRIGYVTDLRFHDENLRVLDELLSGVDQLFIESVFLDEDRDHATRKNHLTARQAGEIARRLRARVVVPFHFSPRYEGRPDAVRAEVIAAWSGLPLPAGATSP